MQSGYKGEKWGENRGEPGAWVYNWAILLLEI
jgi:hypothetical protein